MLVVENPKKLNFRQLEGVFIVWLIEPAKAVAPFVTEVSSKLKLFTRLHRNILWMFDTMSLTCLLFDTWTNLGQNLDYTHIYSWKL